MSTTQLPSWNPRSYQKEGVKLCLSQACAGLLFPPGAGKTSVMYMAITMLRKLGYVRKVLVICPIRPMYSVWPLQKNTYADFEHLTVAIAHAEGARASERRDEALRSAVDIVVINPDGLAWLLKDPERADYVKKNFDMLVVDESTKFKDGQSGRSKLLRSIVPFFKRRYILTGSLTSKGLLDLFGQIYILDEGQSLGRYITKFRQEYFYPTGYGGYEWKPMPDAEMRIAGKLAPLTMRVEMAGNVDLPELVHDDIWIDLPAPARTLYKKMEDTLVAALEAGEVVAANAAVASSKCRQIANGCIYESDKPGEWHGVHTGKYDALQDLIEQLQGEPLLVTYEFGFDRDYLEKKLKIPCISTGSPKHDALHIDLFSKGLLPVVMGHPQSIALGIDGLQNHCHHIAMLGVTWKLEDYQQVIMRVQRSGSKSKTVFLHRILAAGTVDARVIKILDQRAGAQADFMALLKSIRDCL